MDEHRKEVSTTELPTIDEDVLLMLDSCLFKLNRAIIDGHDYGVAPDDEMMLFSSVDELFTTHSDEEIDLFMKNWYEEVIPRSGKSRIELLMENDNFDQQLTAEYYPNLYFLDNCLKRGIFIHPDIEEAMQGLWGRPL